MKIKATLAIIIILVVVALIMFFEISDNNKGINLTIKNNTDITIDNMVISLYNSIDNINIYSFDNLQNLNVKHESINIIKYPKAEYALKVDFTVSGEKSENIIAYLP